MAQSSESAVVGRADPLRRIGEALSAASQGRRSAVLVSGEAGMGKTSLIRAAIDASMVDGVVVGWGTCWHGGGAPGFWPWMQALSDLARLVGDDAVAAAGRDRDILSVLIRDLEPAAQAGTDPDRHRLLLLDAAVRWLGALAVHSILEMMALGLADTFRDCALLTISISLHQPAESIALLVAFIKSGLSESQIIVFLGLFSSMGMIGVVLGMMVNEYAAPIVDSIMLAIVAGTFVYVGATEIIPEEFESSQYKWKKFTALLSGIVTIVCITQYTATLGGH